MAKDATKAKEADLSTSSKKSAEYRVLARKYRPQTFAELKGQDALVRTLSNAIESGRIAHAFMLTGVRGVGKTTTARIIARALNCEQGPTVTPCGVCDQCKSIAEDRHVDVLEMDAASRTGVEDIREIIDSVQYAPVSGRNKIFIIDEVHMLSKNAFNALLKTLEEPPENVRFVFATTEIRKVPVTVLSRCQRFDLRRIDADILKEYFLEILGKEGVTAEDQAIALIARAADGSARDGLSLLDQAISREPDKITEEQVRHMLGLVDRSISFDLFENLMKGDSITAMQLVDNLYKGGADAMMVLQDLLDLTHYLTKTKVHPDVAKDQALPEAERVRGLDMVKKLSVPVLTRTWQILTKGASEIQYAYNPQQALEMVLIRLLFVADHPPLSDLVKKAKDEQSTNAQGNPAPNGGGAGTMMRRRVSGGGGNVTAFAQTEMDTAPQTQTVVAQAVVAVNTFADMVALFGQKKEPLIQAALFHHTHLVKFEKGHVELRLTDGAPKTLISDVSSKMNEWTGDRWIVSVSRAEGQPTLAQIQKQAEADLMDDVTKDPVVAEILLHFPGAKITDIKE